MKAESLTVVIVDSWAIIMRLLRRVERVFNSITCMIMNGGHELYTIREPHRLYQRCLLCGYETKGWKL